MNDDALTAAERIASTGLISGDRIVLAKLAGIAGNGGVCALEAFLHFLTESAAREVAKVLTDDGFACEITAGAGSKPYCVVARRLLSAEPLTVVALRREMEALAAQHGGEFDGWGGSAANGKPAPTAPKFSRPRLLAHAPVHYPFGWPRDRHERLARGIAKCADGELLEVAVEPTDEWRVDLAGAWHWRAALRCGEDDVEIGAYVQLQRSPKDPLAHDRSHASYWLRESEFLSQDVQPVFPMPCELRRPAYHYLLNLTKDANVAGRFVVLERSDRVQDARTWDIERYAQAARALGIWQAQMAANTAALKHPVLLRDSVRHLVPASTHTSTPKHQALLYRLSHHCVQTVSHNLVSGTSLCADPHDSHVTVLRDWRMVGIGALGSDIAGLVCQSPQSPKVGIAQIGALESRVLASYVDGLRAGGWNGDASDIRWAYAASAAVVFGSRTAPTKTHQAVAAHAQRLGEEAAKAL